MARSLLKCC